MTTFPHLPSWPLVLAILKAACEGESQTDLCARVGASDRMLREWRARAEPKARFNRVDKIIQALDLLWWEVYNEDTVRKSLEVVVYGRRRMHKGGPLYRHRMRGEVKVDLGPDYETLRLVEYAFTGEGLEADQMELAVAA